MGIPRAVLMCDWVRNDPAKIEELTKEISDMQGQFDILREEWEKLDFNGKRPECTCELTATTSLCSVCQITLILSIWAN